MTILDIPNVHDLPSLDLDAPQVVKDAIKAAHVAGEAKEGAAQELQEAKAAISQADAADQAVTRTAIAEGARTPKAEAGPKAREAASAAERKLKATEDNYRESVFALTDLMIEHRDEWTAQLTEELAVARDGVTSAVSELEAHRVQTATISATIDNLACFEADPKPGRRRNNWLGVNFRIGRRGKSSEEKREDHRHTIANRGRFSISEGDFEEAAVELELIARGERPWR